MNLSDEFDKLTKPQIQFLELLHQLTNSGRVEWLQDDNEPGFVHCLIDGEDLIKFECLGGAKGDEHVPPAQRLAGIVSHYCNTTYLWLNGLANWELLVQLLRSAKSNEKRFKDCRRIANRAPVSVLEAKLKI